MAGTALLEQRMIVNPFGRQDTDGSCKKQFDPLSQDVRQAEHLEDLELEGLVRRYKNMDLDFSISEGQKRVLSLEPPVLSPARIELFLQRIMQEEGRQMIEERITGLLLTELIKRSYDDNNNDFLLKTKDFAVDNIGYMLMARGNRKIAVTVAGDAGWYLGNAAKNCMFIVNGATRERCGDESRRCTFILQGGVEDTCGVLSKNCSYTIFGDAQDRLGINSEYCVYTVHGTVGDACGTISEYCVFRTSNPKTFKIMQESVMEALGNKVQLLDPDGNVVKEVRP